MNKKAYSLTATMAILVCSVLILAPLNAQATTVLTDTSVMFLFNKYCGADQPAGNSPWLGATFNNESNGTVTLTLNSFGPPDYLYGLQDEEYVASWYFNLNTKLEAENLEISRLGTGNDDIYNAATIITGDTVFHAASDRIFDILFDFTQCAAPNASSVKRFTSNIELKYSIKYNDEEYGFTYNDFFFSSDANGNADKDPFYSAAHVLRIDMPAGENSGWIAIPAPEPCTMILLGSGLLGIAGLRRKFKN